MKYHSIILITFWTFSLFAQEKGVSPINNQQPTTNNQKTYAVVVGISDYQDEGIPDLRFADKDAEAFANFLRSPAGGSLDGDHLKLLTNEQATAGQVISNLYRLLEVCQEGDRVIIYFSGHGDVENLIMGNPGHLLCWDAPPRVYMAGGTLQLYNLQSVITTLSSQLKVKVYVITDACRSGKLSGSNIDGAKATTANLAKQFANEIKILSCQPDEYSIEGEQWGGGRGAFSYHLLDGLYGMADGNKDLSVNLMEVRSYLEQKVSEEVAPQSQLPMVVGNGREKLTDVFPEILAQLKEGRKGQMQLFTPTESRGFDDEVLAEADSSIVEMYLAFQESIENKNFLSPENACADFYYEKLSQEPQLKKLHSSMRRNYAAALQDDAQQVMNTMLKSGLTEKVLRFTNAPDSYKSYPAYLERAATLLGSQHYMYNVLQARKLFFKAQVATQKKERRSLFLQALKLQPDMAHSMVEIIRSLDASHLDSANYFFQRSTELIPSWVEPYVSMSHYYMTELNKPKGAENMLNLAGQIDSSSILVWYNKGKFYFNQKNYNEAEKWLLKAVEKAGDDICFPCLYYDLGILYNTNLRYEEAEQAYFKAIQLDSNFVQAYVNLGNVYNATRRYEEAEQACLKAIQLDSNFVQAYVTLGLIYKAERRFEEAEEYFKKPMQLDSTFVNAYICLGVFHFDTRRYAEAEKQFKKAIELDSTNALAYGNLGNVYQVTRRYAESEILYKKAIELDSTNAHAYISLGNAFRLSHRYTEAEKQYKKAIELDSTNAKAYVNLGVVYENYGNYEKIEKLYLKAIQIDSTLSQAYKNLAGIYRLTFRYKEAEKYYLKTIQLDSTNIDAYNELGTIYMSTRQYEKAKEYYRKAIHLYPNFWITYSNLGILNHFQQQWEEAASMTQKALEINPKDGGLMAEYAYALSHIPSRMEEADTYFQKAIESNPEWPDTYIYLATFVIRRPTMILLANQNMVNQYLEQGFAMGVGKNGVIDVKDLESREDLEILRNEPKWNELMEKYFPSVSKGEQDKN